ncbi:SdiA-regulated domain-containing protein [Pseudothauera nasutitermitis]|uniref:SdiA-regulated domain-containing protein n=1 Tax=Pseudothauera nasutitermitis TaxID=2565930 RepID=UPI001454D37D|nr:SdiA-regulated domain-containing protein [Pseudothauera nasutitermitis]
MDRRSRKWWWVLALGIVLPGAVAVWKYQLVGLAYHWAQTLRNEARWSADGIWLPAYRVTQDALPLEGIADNASGLTYNPHTGTLFTVINKPPAVAELSREGRVLRQLPLKGVVDPEGITHMHDDLFVLAEERSQQLIVLRIAQDATELDAQGAPRLGLAVDLSGNLGFEGVSWDQERQRLLVAKEKSPLRIFEITGLPEALAGSRFDVQIREWLESRSPGLFMRDLSSLTLHEPTGHMLVLSDESKLVVEYDAEGEPVSLMPLWRGRHGLARSVPQPEGIALDDQGALYLLSEPNLFYRFERREPASWMKAAGN